MQKNIAFIGGRGAGKSRLSRKFGKASGRPVLSTDMLISYEGGGLSIADIVKKSGWQGFRDLEFRVLEKVSAMSDCVLDCGGGILVEAPDRPDGFETFSERKGALLRKRAHVVYVKRSMDWLLEKTTKDANRPELSSAYENTITRRLPWFESAADFIIDLDSMSTEDAIELLLQRYGRRD